MRNDADIPVGVAGGRGEVTAFLIYADNPAFLRKGALEALRGQLDFPQNVATSGRLGIDVPLKVNGMGRHVLSVVSSGKECDFLGDRSTQSVPRFAW